MDVKSAFLNGKISKEVYVEQTPRFESSEFPNHVCKLNKALYGLKQAPRALYETLSEFLTRHKFVRGAIDDTLFTYKTQSDVIIVQIYVDDIIFGSISLADQISNSSHVSVLGLWYPKGSGFDLKAYSESNYVGCNLDRKSTSGGCQILGGKLVCWRAKKQTSVAMSSAKAEYVAAAGAIAISNNLVLHSGTKHIDIRYHFIRDHILKGDIEIHFVPTDMQLADIFTKPLAEPSFTRLVAELGMLNIEKQATEELVVIVDPLQSIETSESAEVPEKIVKMEEVAEEQSLEIPTVEQLLDEADKLNKVVQETPESPYDIESEIKVVKSFLTSHISDLQDQTMHDSKETHDIQEDSDTDLQSMPDDDLGSVSGFEVADSDDTYDNQVSQSDHISQEDNVSAERLSLPNHMDHICEEVGSLHSKLRDMKSSIIQQVFAEIKLSLPALVITALKEQLPGLLSATLKDCLPLIIKESLQTHILAASKQFAEKQTKLNKKVVKHLNKQFNISHVAQSNRFVTLQKELSKVLKSELAKSVKEKIQVVRLEGVRDDLQSQTKHLTKYWLSFQNMQRQLGSIKQLKTLPLLNQQLKLRGSLLTKNQLSQSLRRSLNNNSRQLNSSLISCLEPLLQNSHMLLSENQPLPEILPKAKKLPLKNLKIN
ncbi:retrovirus-related pol polyprotein from transposon TNT 1-94 [Tanacetum coccineum]